MIARERSTGPDSRFRFGVWDAEGAFNAIGYAHPALYNTITNDLVAASTNANYRVDVARIFRRLASSPEFRLRFADRVNYHFFNGGILDDRDPDAPARSRTTSASGWMNWSRRLARSSSTTRVRRSIVSPFNAWAVAGSGRRSYLLGSTPGRQMCAMPGYGQSPRHRSSASMAALCRPATPSLITSSVATPGQTAALLLHAGRERPALAGRALNPAALTYTGPVALNQVVPVKARAQNSTTGEWSPLTEATFAPAAVPASSNNSSWRS